MFYELHHIGHSAYFTKEYGTNFSFPPHMHQCFELITLLEGTMTVTVDGKAYDLVPGRALLLFPNQLHSLSSTSSRHMLCIFSEKLVAAFASRLSGKKPLDNSFVPDAYLLEQLDRMQETDSLCAKKGLLYLLCSQFDSGTAYTDYSADSKNLLESIFGFIEQQYAGDCSLENLARHIGYDYAYLSRYFRKTVGLSYRDYVNIYRLNHACYLLGNEAGTVLRCALDSGFTSLRTFNRNFKEQFGVTPSAYISQSRQKEKAPGKNP